MAIVRRLAPEYRACRTHRSVVAELDSLLRVAIESQLADVVDALIVAGADVGREDGDGQRPLHVAAKTGDVAVLKQLVHAGSLLNAVDRNGSSALYLSAVLGHREASLALIDSGATVNRPRRYDTGEAPIHAIARTGDAVVLDAAMRRAGGRTDLHASNGVTPLHVASREHHSGCVAVLCEGARNDAAVNAPDNSGVTSLHCAVQVAALDCVRILLRHGADANAANREGQTPLHYAAAATHPPSFSHAAVVDLLLAFGAKVCRRDALHRTPLHVAAETGNVSLVSVLLSAGADVNAVERVLGETAVNIAAACGRHSVLHELVAAECDVTIADKHGVTPLHKLLSTGANGERLLLMPFRYLICRSIVVMGLQKSPNCCYRFSLLSEQACDFRHLTMRPGN